MKCICQICSCGKHRCPHYMPQKPISKQPCKFTTEYSGEYIKGQGEKKVIHKPKDNLKADGDGDYNTTHKNNFQHFDVQPRPNLKPIDVYTKTDDPMDLDTEYGTKYMQGMKGETAKMPGYFNKKTQPFGDGSQLKGKSVTHEDFHTKKNNERPVIYKLKDNHQPSSARFDSKSIHQQDYQKFDQRGKVVPRRPDNIDSKGIGYYDTTHGSHFQAHQQRPRSSKAHQETYRQTNEPFEGKSLMQTDYKAHHGSHKSAVYHHDNGLFDSNDRFNGETTNHSTYKKWDIQKNRKRYDQGYYQKPTEAMDMQRTSEDYKNFGGKRAAKTLRPKTNVNFGDDFDGGMTSYQDCYKQHEISPRSIYQRERSYYQSDQPFNSISENKDKYHRFPGTAPAQMINRDNDMFNRDAPMQNSTSYGDHFESKKIPECPSTKIITNNFKGYDLIDDFVQGHRFLLRNGDGSSISSSSESTFRGKESPLPPIAGGANNTQVTVTVR